MTNHPAHSRIGASSAYRWMACPGQVNLQKEIEGLGVDLATSSPAAEEGIRAHALLAECLENDKDAWEVADRCDNDEMALHLQTTLDALRALGPGETFVERGIVLEQHPDARGTVDFGHLADGLLSVADFKYGKGRYVSPVENYQLYYYAAGLMQMLGERVQQIRVGIVQPRKQGPGIVWGPVLSPREMDERVAVLAHAMGETDRPDAPLSPGEHCRFCPVKRHCPAQAALLRNNFADAAPPSSLSNEALGVLLEQASHLKSYFDALEAEAYQRLQNGRDVPGWKLVARGAKRRWKEDAEKILVDTFGDGAYSRTLLTPAAVEKLPGGKKLAAELAYMPETGTTLAPASDNRAEVAGRGAAVFAPYLNPKE